MSNHVAILVLSLFVSAADPRLSVPEKPFTAEVRAVYHADSLKLQTPEGQLLVSLYGVKGDPLDLTKMNEAKEFAIAVTKDQTLEIRPVKTISGLSYVEVILPSGEVLNKLLLEKGFVKLDTLSASKDEVYTEIASKAEQFGPNEENVDPDIPSDVAKSERPEDSRQALANFKLKKQLTEIAQFEAEVEKWRALPESYRRSIAASYGYTLRSGTAKLSEETAKRQQKVEGTVQKLEDNQSKIVAHQEAIASVTASEQDALADVYDDFDLKWDQGMAEGFHKNILADVATGDEYSAGINARLLDKYSYKVMLDRSRVDSEASAVSAAHENMRAAHRGEIASLESQHSAIIGMIRRAEADAQAAASITAKHEKHYSDALQRIKMLDEAVGQDLQPSLFPIVTEQFRGNKSDKFAKFPVESIIWRIDWYVKKADNSASFSIDLYEAQNDKFLQHVITEQPPYKSFLICEEPGEYYLKVNADGAVEFIITIVQFGHS
ncbi:MAG: hypothetical protein AMXMBFR82_53370 [Candidatus Hydrogenedentota bacterium]